MENDIYREVNKLIDEANNLSTVSPDESLALGERAYLLSKENNLKLEEGYSLLSMALALRAKSETSKMLKYSLKALRTFETLELSKGYIRTLNIIGIAYFYNSMYDEALKYFLKTIELLDKVKYEFLLSSALNNIGEVFRETNNYDKAIDYYTKALSLCTNNDFITNKASLLCNLGEVYFIKNDYEEALSFFNKSYDILVNENNMILLGEVENNIGKLSYISGNYKEAEEYYNSSLIRLENVNNKYYAIDVLINFAKLYSEKDFSKTISYLNTAVSYAEEINAKKKLLKVFETLAEIYENIGNFEIANDYLHKYIFVKEEIMASSMGNKLEFMMIELEHLKGSDKFERIKEHFEIEIANQKNELKKIKKANEILQRKAYEDELTGIPNRRFFNLHINEEWETYLLSDEEVVLFVIDIDNFKKYNDYWGHLKGDECLIKVANCIKEISNMRNDIFVRYGGEEFIYFAKEINYQSALELGNMLKNEVENLKLNYTYKNNDTVLTVSLWGIIGKPSDIKSVVNLIQSADKELFNAKNLGRNTTVLRNFRKFGGENEKNI